MLDKIRKFRFWNIQIHVTTGGFNEISMHDSFEAGRSWQKGWDEANHHNKYSGSMVVNKEPSFIEWIKNYKII